MPNPHPHHDTDFVWCPAAPLTTMDAGLPQCGACSVFPGVGHGTSISTGDDGQVGQDDDHVYAHEDDDGCEHDHDQVGEHVGDHNDNESGGGQVDSVGSAGASRQLFQLARQGCPHEQQPGGFRHS